MDGRAYTRAGAWPMTTAGVIVAIAWIVASRTATADAVATARTSALVAPPAAPDPARRYVFYLHGKIIEDRGRRPRHPSWGIYEYDRVLEALAATGAVVISEARPAKTSPPRYARKVAGQIQRLLDGGVPPSHIGVVGFSKGGWITHLISSRLDAPIRYVVLAMCPGPRQPRRSLHGHVLSIRERSDKMSASCQGIFESSPEALDTRELVVDIGGGHGAFYRPDAAWLQPLTEFLLR